MKQLAVVVLIAGVVSACVLGPDERVVAVAELAPTAGHQVSGKVRFIPRGDSFWVVAEVRGLTPNAEHGFHLHEIGDCSKPDASSAGGHFNPTGTTHGHHLAAFHHAGDMPNLKADAQGEAQVQFELTGVTLEQAPTAILERGVIVHAGPDDYQSQPAGNAGARAACGVVRRT